MPTPNRTHERLVALFLFGALLFTPPLITLFNSATRVLGLPVLYLYLFGTWAAIIALAALTMERATLDGDPAGPAQTTPPGDETANAEG
jgi:hypothetical protein